MRNLEELKKAVEVIDEFCTDHADCRDCPCVNLDIFGVSNCRFDTTPVYGWKEIVADAIKRITANEKANKYRKEISDLVKRAEADGVEIEIDFICRI